MDDENVLGRKSKVVRQLADPDGCKVYAQIMAVAAFVLELKSDEMNIVPASKGFVAGHLRFRFHTPPVEEEMEQNEEGKDEDEDESQPMDLAEPSSPAPAPASSGASAGDVTSWCYAFELSQHRAFTSAASSTTSSSNSADSRNYGSASGSGAAGCNLIGAAWTSCPANYIEVEWLGETSAEPLWLLVVEKEGVFHRLLEERFPEVA
eukprot:gene14004-16101_t